MTDKESRGDDSDDRPAVVIFAPLPVLTVTVEDRSGEADIHVHAGGQGVWQSRMMSSLGAAALLTAVTLLTSARAGDAVGCERRALAPGFPA